MPNIILCSNCKSFGWMYFCAIVCDKTQSKGNAIHKYYFYNFLDRTPKSLLFLNNRRDQDKGEKNLKINFKYIGHIWETTKQFGNKNAILCVCLIMEVIVFTADYRLSKCYSDSTFATKHQPIHELLIKLKSLLNLQS